MKKKKINYLALFCYICLHNRVIRGPTTAKVQLITTGLRQGPPQLVRPDCLRPTCHPSYPQPNARRSCLTRLITVAAKLSPDMVRGPAATLLSAGGIISPARDLHSCNEEVTGGRPVKTRACDFLVNWYRTHIVLIFSATHMKGGRGKMMGMTKKVYSPLIPERGTVQEILGEKV